MRMILWKVYQFRVPLCRRLRRSVVSRDCVSCSVLQRVAVCCSALQCVAVRCSALQCVAVRHGTLQCVAVRIRRPVVSRDSAL